MPFPCIATGARAGLGLLRRPRLGSENPAAAVVLYLVKPSIQRISLCLPLTLPSVSLVHSHTTVYCWCAKARASTSYPQTPRTCCWGCPRSHSAARTHARTTVFPPSRICSIFPHESCGIRPISFILPVSSCLALKRVWSLRDPLYHYSWTSLFCNCLRSFNEFLPAPNCRRPLVSACNTQILLVFTPKN